MDGDGVSRDRLTEQQVSHQDMRELFGVIDVDQSGSIDANELRLFLHESLDVGTMNFPAFHSAMFELASLWVPEPQTEDRVVLFLQVCAGTAHVTRACALVPA